MSAEVNGILRPVFKTLVCCAAVSLGCCGANPFVSNGGRAHGQDRASMQFTLIDGSRLEGALQSADRQGRLSIRSPWAIQPLEMSEAALLEGWNPQAENRMVEGESAAGSAGAGTQLAFLMQDGSQFVGQVQSASNQQVILRGADVSAVTLPTKQIVGIRRPSNLLRPLVSIVNAPHRFSRQQGWRLGQGVLRSESPAAALVADLDLPSRFRILMDARCSGNVDFELILGTRSEVGAGQGGRPAGLDRRGGSIARSPTETLITRLEWFGSDVALVRSNASVSDSSLFPVDSERLQLELLVDQERGWLLAYQSGQLVGQAKLVDEQPIVRRRLTLFSRSDPVQLNRFEILQWDGVAPESRFIPPQHTLLSDGTLLDRVPDQWTDQGLQMGQQLIRWNDLSSMQIRFEPRYSPGVEVLLDRGTRLRGHLLAHQETSQMLLSDNDEQRIHFAAGRVTRFFGGGVPLNPRDSGTQRLSYRGAELKGTLLASAGTTIRWRADHGDNVQDLIPVAGLEIRFESRSAVTRPEADRNQATLLLRDGDTIAGRLLMIDGQQLLFESPTCGRVTLPTHQIQQLSLGSGRVPDPQQMDLLLSLPRRAKENPPTHLLVSLQGDILRGRLLAVDEQQVKIEVRGRQRSIPRERIGLLLWLDPQTQDGINLKTNETESAGGGPGQRINAQTQPSGNVITLLTRGGTRLQLDETEFDGKEFRGTHPLLGPCRLAEQEISQLTFGTAASPGRKPLRLVPVLEPKSFD